MINVLKRLLQSIKINTICNLFCELHVALMILFIKCLFQAGSEVKILTSSDPIYASILKNMI